GNEAFRECSWMTSVRISGNALRKIGDAAFAGCDHLASINIPDGVTTIGGGVFDLCGSLKELDIPASVKTMGDNLIEDCDELKTIKVHWTKPISVPKNAFSGQERYITLKVPAGTEA
ncbi:leucine-rich repeat domain-containing protein, partial [Tannerella forsythia]